MPVPMPRRMGTRSGVSALARLGMLQENIRARMRPTTKLRVQNDVRPRSEAAAGQTARAPSPLSMGICSFLADNPISNDSNAYDIYNVFAGKQSIKKQFIASSRIANTNARLTPLMRWRQLGSAEN